MKKILWAALIAMALSACSASADKDSAKEESSVVVQTEAAKETVAIKIEIPTTTEAEKVQCDACGGWYEAGNIFRNHICSGAVTQTEAEMVLCNACGGWYEAGNIFRNHICVS